MPNSPPLSNPNAEDTCKVLIEPHDGDENEIDDGEPSTDGGGVVEEASEGAGRGGRVVEEATKFQWGRQPPLAPM